MPLVRMSVPAGALSAAQKTELITRITDVVVDVEGIEELRPLVHVLIDEIPDGGWGTGGRAWTLAALAETFGSKRDSAAP